MRLTKKQVEEIKSALKPFLKNQPSKLYLVGSRTKEHLKGGDIDLLLILNDNKTKEQIAKVKPVIINEIMKQPTINDTKVDLILGLDTDLQNDPFVSTLNNDKVLIEE